MSRTYYSSSKIWISSLLRAVHERSCLWTSAECYRLATPLLVIIFLAMLTASCSNVVVKTGENIYPTSIQATSTALSAIPNSTGANLKWVSEWEMYDVNEIAWSPDGTKIAAVGEDEKKVFGVNVYSSVTYVKLWFAETDLLFGVTFAPAGDSVVVPIYYDGIAFLDSESGQTLRTIGRSYLGVPCYGGEHIQYSSDDGSLALTSRYFGGNSNDFKTEVYLWDMVSGHCLERLFEDDGIAFSFDISRDAQLLVLGVSEIKDNADPQIHTWDINTRRKICSFNGTLSALDPFTNTVATANAIIKGDVDLWNAKTCELIYSINRSREITSSMAFSPDGQLLAIIGDTIQIWQTKTKEILFESIRLSRNVEKMAFSPDGRFLLTVSPRSSAEGKATITLWEVVRH